MSTQHYSKFSLNTWSGTPYFKAYIPSGYPLSMVLQKSRAFRRLPNNLRKLAEKSKEWALLNGDTTEEIKDWYDDAGNELDPETGKKLTDAEIDHAWEGLDTLDNFAAQDLPIGDFPDPKLWEPPPSVDTEEEVTSQQLLKDIYSRGRKYVSRAYGIPLEELPGYSPLTVEEKDGEDWDIATQRFRERAARVMGSKWMQDHPEDRKIVAEALQHAILKWDLYGDAEASFDIAEDHT